MMHVASCAAHEKKNALNSKSTSTSTVPIFPRQAAKSFQVFCRGTLAFVFQNMGAIAGSGGHKNSTTLSTSCGTTPS